MERCLEHLDHRVIQWTAEYVVSPVTVTHTGNLVTCKPPASHSNVQILRAHTHNTAVAAAKSK